jgi:hypothetical protein
MIQIFQECIQIFFIDLCSILEGAKLLHVTPYTMHLIPDEEKGNFRPVSQGCVHCPMTFDLNFVFHA